MFHDVVYIVHATGTAQEPVTWDGVSCVYNAQRNITAGSSYSS